MAYKIKNKKVKDEMIRFEIESQKYPFLIDKVTGKKFKRIKYGEKTEDWGAKKGYRCHDCGVKVGQYHVYGCDVERSPMPSERGSQLLTSERVGNLSK